MKAPSPKFHLRYPNAATSSIFMKVHWPGGPLVYGTGLTLDPTLWDNNTMRVTENKKMRAAYGEKSPQKWREYSSINLHLEKLKSLVVDYFVKSDYCPSVDDLRVYLIKNDSSRSDKPQEVTLNSFIDSFIDEIENGKRLTPQNERYKPTTVKAVKSFRVRFTEFQTDTRKIYQFDTIDKKFYTRFREYLSNKKGNKPNSIGKQVKTLKTIMQAAMDLSLHSNAAFKSFKVVQLESEEVYLTEEELKKIASLDLSKSKPLETARDVFLIGCYTAQRFSDYSRITKSNIKTAAGRVVELRQKKTNTRVVIPIKPELWTLLEKYDFSTPHIIEQHLNKRIKEIGKLAGIDTPTPISEYRNGFKVQTHVPKFTLIQSHTARRTGATLMHLYNVALLDIAKITGHKTPKELMKYIRITEDETAQKLMQHAYFSPLTLLKKK